MERTDCQRYRIERVSGEDAASSHASTCASCAEWSRRLALHIQLLSALPRVAAPDELESRVVGALQAGDRQTRAIRALRGLGRLRGPESMDEAVAGVAGAPRPDPLSEFAERREAPFVLARLIDEELIDPAKARVARQVRSLPRCMAPDVLAERVNEEMLVPRARSGARGTFAWVALFAAGIAAAVAIPWLALQPRYPFRVEYVSEASMGPTAHVVLNGFDARSLTLDGFAAQSPEERK